MSGLCLMKRAGNRQPPSADSSRRVSERVVRGRLARFGGLRASRCRVPLNLPSRVKGNEFNWRSAAFADQHEHIVPCLDGAREGHLDPAQLIGLVDHPPELIIPAIQCRQPSVFQVESRC